MLLNKKAIPKSRRLTGADREDDHERNEKRKRQKVGGLGVDDPQRGVGASPRTHNEVEIISFSRDINTNGY